MLKTDTNSPPTWSDSNDANLTNTANVQALAINPPMAISTLYAGTEDDGIFRSGDGGTSWNDVDNPGLPANEDVRALARAWGNKKTYLAPGGLVGFGSASRCATGTEWARSMVCLMAMQGLGKPGVNMGCGQQGTPVDTSFYFPGYSEGGYSGDLAHTGLAINLYQRMPQILTMNSVNQSVPRLKIPEAILNGERENDE